MILVFLSCQEVSGNQQKLKRNYIAADGNTDDFQGQLLEYLMSSNKSFFKKIHHKILHLEIQLIFFHPLGVSLKNGPK